MGPALSDRRTRASSPLPHRDRTRVALAVVSFAVYVGSIATANWMISHVGQLLHGTHYLPVGFGLRAP
jgi:hypothetical protein